MGTPAWQKREGERQQFLENLYQDFLQAVEQYCEKEGSQNKSVGDETQVIFEEADELLEHIRQMRYTGHLQSDSGGDHFRGTFGGSGLLAEPLDRIKAFQKTIEEGMALKVVFLDRLLKSALIQFHTLLTTQELEHPEFIYGHFKRMDEMPD